MGANQSNDADDDDEEPGFPQKRQQKPKPVVPPVCPQPQATQAAQQPTQAAPLPQTDVCEHLNLFGQPNLFGAGPAAMMPGMSPMMAAAPPSLPGNYFGAGPQLGLQTAMPQCAPRPMPEMPMQSMQQAPQLAATPVQPQARPASYVAPPQPQARVPSYVAPPMQIGVPMVAPGAASYKTGSRIHYLAKSNGCWYGGVVVAVQALDYTVNLDCENMTKVVAASEVATRLRPGEGERIQYLARSNNQWYAGVVQAIDSSVYAVRLDCGETKEVAVTEVSVRVRPA